MDSVSVRSGNQQQPHRIGILTCFEHDWWLSRYVRRLCDNRVQGEIVVLAEQDASYDYCDEENYLVRPCWKRNSTNYQQLGDVLREYSIDLVHVNCCFPYFDSLQFRAFVEEQRRRGVVFSAHVHDSHAIGAMHVFLSEQCELVVVDNQRTRVTAVFEGIASERIHVLESAVDRVCNYRKAESRRKWNLPETQTIVVCFDSGLPESKLENIISAVYEAKNSLSNMHLYVLPLAEGLRGSGSYGDAIRERVSEFHLEKFVNFVEGISNFGEFQSFLGAADFAVLSSSRPEFEAREILGAVAECGIPLISTIDTPCDSALKCLVEVRANDSLSNSLVSLAKSADLSRLMSEELFAWAERNDASKSMPQLSELWMETYTPLSPLEDAVLTQLNAAQTFENLLGNSGAHAAPIRKVIPAEQKVTPIHDGSCAEQLCGEADVCMHQEDLTSADQKYALAEKISPDCGRAYRGRGVVALMNNHPQLAETFFCKALEHHPTDVKATVGLGAAYWYQGEREKAFELYLRAATNEPGNLSAIAHLVKAGFQLGKFSELERVLREATRRNRGDLHIQYCLAGCYFRQQKLSLAGGVVEHILRLDPTHPSALELKKEIEKLAFSENMFESTESKVEIDDSMCGFNGAADKSEESKFAKEIQVMEQEEIAVAWSKFETMLDEDEEDRTALLGLASLAETLGKLQELNVRLLQYLELHPAELSVLFAHAECLANLGELKEAHERCERILLFEPDHEGARRLLSRL